MKNVIYQRNKGKFDYSLTKKAITFLLIIFSIVIPAYGYFFSDSNQVEAHEFISPTPQVTPSKFVSPEATGFAQLIEKASPTPTKTPTPTPTKAFKIDNLDLWVNKYVRKYITNEGQVSVMKAKMHFLLSKESKHDLSKGHGDNGKAGGCLQFWEETWNRMRGQMIKAQLISEIGTRYNCEQAIETTVWAITQGREKEWGPILRNEIKL